ncbi:hypothetical protein HYH02_006704 [Chlamydomonas schloesseri]|uniref:Centrosomin N-terminal motif 1 domain-containing protein n=1 Tax=Chlamydomonas schloesseri TaxID=2026947 RepID=A0A836B5V0_9CHLO|nr:hypothetical protein HYH02_006704 [Chlamydomonas schloesseri]|eukprot:KAG2448119.1 hypothetical protein HYH02_006704 [Chlamydomonas schloesseri]
MATTVSPKRSRAAESIVQLKEENFCLRLQVTKLQVALRKSARKDGSRSSPARLAPAAVSQEQMDTVMNELVALRQQVGHLHEENRRLQAQLQALQGAHVAGHGDEEPWIGARQDAFSRGDIQYIEREILCLKQKLSDTRQKLRVTNDQHPAPQNYHQQHATQEAAQTGAAARPTWEPLGAVSLNRDHDSFSFFPQPAAAAVTGAQRSKPVAKAGAGSSSKSAAPSSALRARAGAATAGTKKTTASGARPLKENRASSTMGGLPAARSKAPRKG